ncbi:hypothetical protein CKAH01_12231 [Colletotrichum kahawae]|uniref:Uncharacterized protein n=1 Tax=Colletotrichum kahawae TaxID=34407 RepID=A0AAD9YRJ8_COLKA|nr:hypothetical protein CKAH01_12231 [Colletotrichum kahawae]
MPQTRTANHGNTLLLLQIVSSSRGGDLPPRFLFHELVKTLPLLLCSDLRILTLLVEGSQRPGGLPRGSWLRVVATLEPPAGEILRTSARSPSWLLDLDFSVRVWQAPSDYRIRKATGLLRGRHWLTVNIPAGAAPATEQRNRDSSVAGVVEEACETKGALIAPVSTLKEDLGRNGNERDLFCDLGPRRLFIVFALMRRPAQWLGRGVSPPLMGPLHLASRRLVVPLSSAIPGVWMRVGALAQ